MKLAILLALLSSAVFAQQVPRSIPVLMYHQVTTAYPPGDTVVSPRTFTKHLDMLRDEGYRTITITEVSEYMRGKIDLPAKVVALTFDDGRNNNLAVAQDLVQRDISGTFFVLSGVFTDSQYLSKQDIQWIARQPTLEIGAHSHTHFMEFADKLDIMDDRLMLGEMAMSKAILEQITGKPIKSLAWPFGYSRQKLDSIVTGFGFESGAQVNSKTNNVRGASLMNIQRLNINGHCSPDQVKRIIETQTLENCE